MYCNYVAQPHTDTHYALLFLHENCNAQMKPTSTHRLVRYKEQYKTSNSAWCLNLASNLSSKDTITREDYPLLCRSLMKRLSKPW